MIQGEGVLKWPNGDTYQGGFERGLRHGYGVHIIYPEISDQDLKSYPIENLEQAEISQEFQEMDKDFVKQQLRKQNVIEY